MADIKELLAPMMLEDSEQDEELAVVDLRLWDDQDSPVLAGVSYEEH